MLLWTLFFLFYGLINFSGTISLLQISVLTNAASELSTQCASSSSSSSSYSRCKRHMINRQRPVALRKCVCGGVRHSITERSSQSLRRCLTHVTINELFTESVCGEPH